MKKIFRCVLTYTATLLLLLANPIQAETTITTIPIQADTFEHIQFKKIKSNSHTFENGVLRVDVESSASFLMLPFDTVKEISQLSFEWRSEGMPEIDDIKHESTRQGDDAVAKIGLLLKADSESFSLFAPSWLKRVRELMHYPSENMVYLVANAKHAVGDDWINPYNERIAMVPIASLAEEGGWQQASHQLERPLEVVAIWVMADGDNTKSHFTSYIKNIRFK